MEASQVVRTKWALMSWKKLLHFNFLILHCISRTIVIALGGNGTAYSIVGPRVGLIQILIIEVDEVIINLLHNICLVTLASLRSYLINLVCFFFVLHGSLKYF